MRSAPLFRALLLLLLWGRAAACPVKSCCRMTREELESCVGVHAQCPSSGRLPQVATNRCEECAHGQCRLPRNLSSPRDTCICPSVFLAEGSLQALCRTAHNAAWPDSAASTRPVLDRRHCAGAVLNALRAVITSPMALPADAAERCPVKPCCAMTPSELNSCRGLIETCPNKSTVFRNTCAECPRGTCRVASMGNTDACVCPRDFSTKEAHVRCFFVTGKSWPESAGLQESGRPRCVSARHLPSGELAEPLPSLSPEIVMKCPIKDCCAMSREELLACRGVHEKCPGNILFANVTRVSCIQCPRGLCRVPGKNADVPDQCRCPDFFFRASLRKENKELHERCRKSHGAAWPLSADRTQRGRKHCAAQRTVEANQTPEVPSPGQSPSERGDPTPQISRSPPSEAQRRRRLNQGELAGIVTGTVSALAAVAAVVVAVFKVDR